MQEGKTTPFNKKCKFLVALSVLRGSLWGNLRLHHPLKITTLSPTL